MLRFIFIIIVSLLSGCTRPSDLRTAEGTGTLRSYPVPPDVMGGIALDISRALDFTVVEQSKEYILLKKGKSSFSYGDYLAIFIKGDSSLTHIEIVGRPKFLFPSYWTSGKDYTAVFFMAIESRLANK